MVRQINSLNDLQQLIQTSSSNHLLVLDFYADWCGPCKFIAPVFEQLASQFPSASFLKVNVDHARDISQRYGVQAMPTFLLIKNKVEVQRIQGANAQALEQAIRRHYSDAPANPQAATGEERQFLEVFVQQSGRALFYNDIVRKTLALSLIPSEKLREEATTSNGSLNTFLLVKGLLEWFKHDFFSWCDSPVCSFCAKQCDRKAGLHGTPTSQEREDGAERVEVYICECNNEVRFPRYNDPAKLLETRSGRCGEWANCFALMASAMDLDVRFIYDTTDHVWCEVWIPELDRWVHCDPCENQIDAPLLYEKGWSKKLSYVIAFGLDHVYDVTWRYVVDNLDTLKGRRAVRETVLGSFLQKLNTRMMRQAVPSRVEELKRRRVRELIEFLVIGKKKTDQKYGGRTTGSEDWRSQRGELGGSPKKRQQIVLRPNDEELAAKKMEIRYNCPSDYYTRGGNKIKGWSSYVFKSKDIMRKTEPDWKKAYLCRKEGKEEGEITWAIDLTGVKGKSAKLSIQGLQKYENGQIFVIACAENVCLPVPSNGKLVIDELPSALLKITATLSGGNGDCAFQHAQLFRSDMSEVEDQLVIEIFFE